MSNNVNTTAITAENLKKLGFAEWTHPGTGEVRIYINDLPGLYGLRCDRYRSGNVACATLNGDKISNAAARRILGALSGKMWLSGDGKLMQRGLDADDARVIRDALIAKIEQL